MPANHTKAQDDEFAVRAARIKKRIETDGHSWGLTASEIKQMQGVCDNIFSDEREKKRNR
jgi:hypothetical protein